MSKKIRRPKVNVPGYVKVAAMLSPSSKGNIDRQYIRMMCSAIDSFNNHRNDNIRKIMKETSSDE